MVHLRMDVRLLTRNNFPDLLIRKDSADFFRRVSPRSL